MSRPVVPSLRRLWAFAALTLAATSCGDDTASNTISVEEPAAEVASAVGSLPVGAVGLAVEVDNGAGVPLSLRAGQAFYVNQIDLRASVEASVDEGVAGLDASGDFAALDWDGVFLRDTEALPQPNPDGTFTRRRFYRGAAWMEDRSKLTLTQVNASGAALGPPVKLDAGKDDKRKPADTFFIRRLRAIQWTYDCLSTSDCTGASSFMEEALVELRNTTGHSPVFTLHPQTAAFELRWSQKPGGAYVIPVTQLASPPYAYGFSAEVTPVTPPAAGGVYQPGQDITFQITLRDGDGNRLHPEGSLPTYADVVLGGDDSGIQYWRGPVEASATYWRRKHRERMLAAQIIGPAQDIQPIRSFVDVNDFFGPYVTGGKTARDGVLSQLALLPPASTILIGSFDPSHAAWHLPATDTFQFHIDDDANPGTYLVTLKARRTYLGEDIPVSKTIEIQVGTPAHTTATLDTGPCNTCHSGGSTLKALLHGNDNRAACAGCHAPLPFEYEGPIHVRVHYIHSRSDRVDAPPAKCASCHLTPESIQRTSKAACLSCHTSYPADHVASFGPITSSYVGGGTESFDACAGTCHQTHPGDGL